ncbi:MAG: hypothetical protein WEB01_10455 [Nitrosopumilus sp.]
MESSKLKWTEADTIAVKEYKSKVREGSITPMNYTGNLKDILSS